MSRIVFLYEKSVLDDGELDAVKSKTNWFCTDSILDIKSGDLVIARHTMWPWPKRLQNDIKKIGATLLNGLREYVYADSPASWSWDLQELTPKTYNDFSTLPENTHFILKGAKADKSSWKRMYAENKREAIDLMVQMNSDSRYEGQDIVAREYIPLERLFWDGKSCPISTEYRVFVLDGKIVSSGFYWMMEDCEQQPTPFKDVPKEFLEEAISRIGDQIRFYTLDIAKTAAGSWIVIEISDGQRAGLSNNDPEILYAKMAEVFDSLTTNL